MKFEESKNLINQFLANANNKNVSKEKEPKEPKEKKGKKTKEDTNAVKTDLKKTEEGPLVLAQGEHFGTSPLLRSEVQHSGKEYIDLKDVVKRGQELVGQSKTIRARLYTSRAKGNAAFIVLREQLHTLQACGFANSTETPNMSKDFVKFINSIPKESIIDVTGRLNASKVDACSIKEFEFWIDTIQVVSLSTQTLPFQVSDANNSILLDPKDELEEGASSKEGQINVNPNTRLNTRWLDLRTETSHSIMRVKTKITQQFRNFNLEHDFVEIHTPKLIPGASEGGANVFTFQYFNQTACLAQSPQLYKQMAICSDMKRVFEIGPVFRAENSFTHRHLCEFTGADIEMVFKDHYHEVLDHAFKMLTSIFDSIERDCGEYMAQIRKQYKAEPFKYVWPVPIISYKEAIDLLREHGDLTAKYYEDLTTPQEKVLGNLFREKYNTDFYCIEKYPLCIRPFYTMPAPDAPLEMDGIQVPLSNSYDVFMRGEEIISGAQRVHDAELLVKRCHECKIPLEGVKDYIDAFRQGCEPHAGIGIGLDRVVMLYCGLKNIRSSAMFPRDPKRIRP